MTSICLIVRSLSKFLMNLEIMKCIISTMHQGGKNPLFHVHPTYVKKNTQLTMTSISPTIGSSAKICVANKWCVCNISSSSGVTCAPKKVKCPNVHLDHTYVNEKYTRDNNSYMFHHWIITKLCTYLKISGCDVCGNS